MQGIDTRSAASAAWMEHQVLEHLKAALRVTLDWDVAAVGPSRKLSSLQFMLQSFQRHLERLMDLEERDGYLPVVAETKPNMAPRVERLEREHAQFRRAIRRLLAEIEAVSTYQSEELERLCEEVRGLLLQIDRHDAGEIDLIQETMLYDEGGEG